MSLSIGLIGMPNVGKSTLLNALTAARAEASNYPFCTIDRNIGSAEIPDPNLQALAETLEPESSIPAQILFVDIAGLVKGAHDGEGLGNKFLSHVREADALVHVVRCFEDDSIAHVTGTIDPIRDVDIIETELLLADLAAADKGIARAARVLKGDPKSAEGKGLMAFFETSREHLDQGTPLAKAYGDDDPAGIAVREGFLTAKPVLFIANVAEDDARGESDAVTRLRERVAPAELLPISARIEEELGEIDADERAEYLAELSLEASGLDRLVDAGRTLLDLITFYTIANDRLQAWLVPRGTRAVEAAGKIHTDMAKGFIRAEVMRVTDVLEHKTRSKLHDLGLLRTEGKDCIVEDGDILHILFQS